MSVPEFNETELKVVGENPAKFGMPATPIFNYPCTVKEAVNAAYRREPYWQVFGIDMQMMTPGVNPDNIARAFAFEAQEFKPVTDRCVPDICRGRLGPP